VGITQRRVEGKQGELGGDAMKTSLEVLLQSGEGQYIEYKSCFDRAKNKPAKPRTLKSVAKDIAICLAEFANADGGTLLVGVENDGTVSACPYTQEEIEIICQMAADSWKKAVPYRLEMLAHTNGAIVAFEIDAQAEVYTLTDGRTPYRNNDLTVWFSAETVKELKRSRTSTLVERMITAFGVSELDTSLLQRFRSKIGAMSSLSDEELLIQHDLAVPNGNGVKLTLAACLLFGKPPMIRFHERCGINFRRFDGTVALSGAKNNERLDVTIELPLPLLLEETFRLIQTQIGVSRKLRDLFFEERPEYPTFAWQEAIVNAVVHRDYSLRGNEIEVRMFDDRLEVRNPGLPPEPVTIEDLQQRKSVHASRNPRIMRVFKALGFVRERGEGLPRVFEEVEESCLPAPELSADGSFFKIVLRNTPIFDDETMRWLKQFPLEKLNARQRRVLAYCRQSGKGYFTLRDYVRENHIDKDASKKEIRELVEHGVIELVGNRKAAKYYPLMQRGTIEEKLREYFSRHDFLKNATYRALAGGVHRLTALKQLKDLEQRGLLRKEGKGKGTRYFPTHNLINTR
jgi:ATP-dependent DNA helicase RecG